MENVLMGLRAFVNIILFIDVGGALWMPSERVRRKGAGRLMEEAVSKRWKVDKVSSWFSFAGLCKDFFEGVSNWKDGQ